MDISHELIEAIIANWKRVVGYADDALLDLSDQELQLQIAPGRNRVYYILGHLAAVCDRVLPHLGAEKRLHPELDILFIDVPDGAKADIESSEHLGFVWSEITDAISCASEKLTFERWLEKDHTVASAGFLMIAKENRLALFMSLTNHVAYHLGQVRLAR